jgi:hypothetical protein
VSPERVRAASPSRSVSALGRSLDRGDPVRLFHIIACALVYTGVAVAANRLLRSRPRAGLIIGRISGAAMILVAIALIIEQALHA